MAAKLIDIDPDLKFAVNEAKKIYVAGGIFIYPTDTIYGFGCNPFDNSAMEKLNNLKGRDKRKQYILLVDSLETLQSYVELKSKKIISVLNNIWPNPISIILNLNLRTKALLNQESAAFRIPDSNFCINLLKQIKAPLVSTSVNITKNPPLTDYSSIKSEFADRVNAIFYSLTLKSQGESTLLDLRGANPKVLREGQINFIELWEKFN